MKILTLCFIVLLTGCAQLMKGEQQSVKQINAKESIYFTTCGGSVETWQNCYSKAKATCKNAYDVLKRDESPVGGKRELTFKCQ